jgi:hypothetical protein
VEPASRKPQLAKTVLGAVTAGVAVFGLASCGNTSTDVVKVTQSEAAAATPASCVVSSDPGEFGSDDAALAVQSKVVSEVLAPRFGLPSKGGGGGDQLSRGFVGLAIDRRAREYVAVVDASSVDVAQLDADLKRSAAAAAGTGAPVRFRAQGACFSTAELQDAAQVLRAGDWHPRAKEAARVWSLNAADSTYHVEVTDPEVADALKKVVGDRVTFADD